MYKTFFLVDLGQSTIKTMQEYISLAETRHICSICLSVCLSVAYITYFCSFKYRENSISVTLHAAVFAYCEAPVASTHFCRVV